MQESGNSERKSKGKGFGSMSKGLMLVGILLLLGVIGILVYFSQPKAQESPATATPASAQVPESEAPARTKRSIGVYSTGKSEAPASVLKGETTEGAAPDDNTIKGTPFLTGERAKSDEDATETAANTFADSAVQETDSGKDKTTAKVTAPVAQAEKNTKAAQHAHKKKQRRNAETFFEIAPGSGTHKRDALDYVAP